MAIENIKDEYIKLVAVQRVVSGYERIAKIENTDKDMISKKWSKDGGIDGYISDKLGIKLDELLELKSNTVVLDEKEKIDKLFRNQFTGKRKEGFETFENFYCWYKKQGDKCHYCKIDSNTLKILFEEEKLKSTKFNETLHIERLRPKESYSDENCRLACSLCNNAKSDLIAEEHYKKYFASAMKNFLDDLYNGKIN